MQLYQLMGPPSKLKAHMHKLEATKLGIEIKRENWKRKGPPTSGIHIIGNRMCDIVHLTNFSLTSSIEHFEFIM